MEGTLSIFYFLILIFSIIAHEVMHGLIAEKEGDPTARMLGRITLNPLKHIDWFGSILLPLMLVVTHAGFVVGWAKPVPYNPDNVEHGRKSVAKIAAAGPLTNITIAIIFSLLARLLIYEHVQVIPVYDIMSIIIMVNLVLAAFNLLPLAPLDGFNILNSVLPRRFDSALRTLERASLPLLLLVLFFGWKFIVPLLFKVFTLLTGFMV